MWGACRTALTVLAIAVIASPVSSVYFNPMMPCQQFCQMLTKDYLRQVWCLIDVCKDSKLRKKLVALSKRSGGSGADNGAYDYHYNNNMGPRLSPYDLSSYYMAGLLDKREKEYWNGPAPKDADTITQDRLFKAPLV